MAMQYFFGMLDAKIPRVSGIGVAQTMKTKMRLGGNGGACQCRKTITNHLPRETSQ
jgi:hypothetical protein